MSVTNELLTKHQFIIEQLSLIPGDQGVFDVHVDGNLIFSKDAVDRHAEDGEILRLFGEHLGLEGESQSETCC